MRNCKLRIATTTDGEERVFTQRAEMELNPLSAVLRYTQDGGNVVLKIENSEVTTERTGDYRLKLRFAEGKRTVGSLGIMSSDGEIGVVTHKLLYKLNENSLLLSVKYALLLNGGEQEVSLLLTATGENISEEK